MPLSPQTNKKSLINEMFVVIPPLCMVHWTNHSLKEPRKKITFATAHKGKSHFFFSPPRSVFFCDTFWLWGSRLNQLANSFQLLSHERTQEWDLWVDIAHAKGKGIESCCDFFAVTFHSKKKLAYRFSIVKIEIAVILKESP